MHLPLTLFELIYLITELFLILIIALRVMIIAQEISFNKWIFYFISSINLLAISFIFLNRWLRPDFVISYPSSLLITSLNSWSDDSGYNSRYFITSNSFSSKTSKTSFSFNTLLHYKNLLFLRSQIFFLLLWYKPYNFFLFL